MQSSAQLVVDGALGGPWERLGDAICDAGMEDSSGLRRHLSCLLARREYEPLCSLLKVDEAAAEELRGAFVAAFGEP